MKSPKLRIFTILLTATLAGILFAYTAHAVYTISDTLRPDNMPLQIDIDADMSGEDYLRIILQIVAGALLYLAAPIAVIAITMSGFNMVAYSSSEEKVGEAKKHLTWSIIGLALVIFSYSLIKMIITFVPAVFDEVPITEPTAATQDGGDSTPGLVNPEDDVEVL